MKGKRGKDRSNERGSFSLMGLGERQIKTKDSPLGKSKKRFRGKGYEDEKRKKIMQMVHTYL